MKKIIITLLLFIGAFVIGQEIINLKKIKPGKLTENITVEKITTDKNTSSFVIWIRDGVKLHKHTYHTESLVVIQGKGDMQLGEEIIEVKKGDFFTIPENTPHGVTVTSSKPMKVLSMQSPEFKGVDRIFIEE
ncbi:MAG: cupin domain-containing protein [Crocinitomicaceae bacterium]|nr:cupin domain-containing protein [Crocinitomicaceae bacterium]